MPNRDIVFTLKFKNLAGQVMRKFGTQLKKMGSASRVAGKGLEKLSRTFKKLAVAATTAGRKLKAAGAAIREAGTNIAFSIGAPLAAAVAISVKAFSNFDLAMKGVEKTVEATPKQLEALGKSFIAMSLDISTSAVELARIGQIAGQLGIAVNDISDFSRVIAEFGVATEVSVETAAFSLARLGTIMQIPTEQTRNLASSMVALGNNFAANEPEIINMSLRIAKAGKVVGLTAGEVFGFSTALASVGVNAQAGGTAISKSFIKINKVVNEGGEKLQLFADIAGLTADEFSTLFRADAAEAFRLFAVGLERTRVAGGDVLGVLEDLGLQEIRTQQAILGLALASGTLTKALRLGNKAFDEGTALAKEADVFFGALANRMLVVKNNFTEIARSLGAAFAPQIDKVVDKLVDFAGKMRELVVRLSKLPDATKELILKIVAFGIILGPVIIVVGVFISILGALITGLALLPAALAVVGPAFVTAFAFVTGPVGIAVAAIAIVSAALFKFRNSTIQVGEKTAQVRDIVVAVWRTIKEQIVFVAQFAADIWDKAILSIQLAFDGLGETFDGLTSMAVPPFTTFFNFTKSVGNAIIVAFRVVALQIIIAFKSAFALMETLAENAVTIGGNIGDAFIAIATGADAVDVLDALFRGTKSPVEGIAEATAAEFSEIELLLSGKKDFIGDLVGGIMDLAGQIGGERMAAGVKKKKPLADGLDGGPAVEKAGEIGADAGAAFVNQMEQTAALTEDVFKGAFDNIGDALAEFIETGKFSFKDFALELNKTISSIALKSLKEDLTSSLSGEGVKKGGLLSSIGGLFKSDNAALTDVGAGGAGETIAGITPGETGSIVTAVTDGTRQIGEFFTGLGTKFVDGLKTLGGLFSDGLKGLGTLFSGGEGGGGILGSILGFFSSASAATAAAGGISDQLSRKTLVPLSMFANAKKFAQGGVTSGSDRIPALLSRNEAVVPLSRNRAIPIEGMNGGTTNITFNVQTNDAESFKQSRSQMLARFGTAVNRARRRTQ